MPLTLEFLDDVLGAVDWSSTTPLDSAAFYGFPLRDESPTRPADTDDSARPAKRRRPLTTEVSMDAPCPVALVDAFPRGRHGWSLCDHARSFVAARSKSPPLRGALAETPRRFSRRVGPPQ